MNYGRYNIVSELGKGAMGMVYKGHDPQIDRMVALKVLREDRLTTEDYVQRFLKEATAIGRLSHPGIVTVYDVGQDHGTIYIAMEFLEGQSMDQLVKAGTLSMAEIVDIGIQIANALHYAHERGIVHRDIKPPNIIYTPEKTIKVTDFGIAHIDDPDGQQMTRAGEILGTPVYMAPEQVLGQTVDGRSDLYSLGVILYELTTGRRPFQGDNLAAVFRAITQDDPVPPDQLNPDVPPAFSNLILKVMSKKPEDRFASGQELAGLLAGCLEARVDDSFTETVIQDLPGELPQSRKSNKGIFLAAGLLLCAAGVAAALYLGVFNKDQQADRDIAVKVENVQERSTQAEDSQIPAVETEAVPSRQEEEVAEKPEIKAEPFPPVTGTAETVLPPKGENVLPQQDAESFDELFKEDRGDVSATPPAGVRESSSFDDLFGSDEKPTVKAAEETAAKKPEAVKPEVSVLPPVEIKQTTKQPGKTAVLNINSTPAGASLYIDGDYRGVTPIELSIAAMKHEVKLELKGHLDWQAQLNLSKGGTVPLSIPLLAE